MRVEAVMVLVKQLTLSRRFMLVSLLVMLAGALVIGAALARQIETRVIKQTAAVTALYVDSYLAPYLQELADGRQLSQPNQAFLNGVISQTGLGRQIVSFKIWLPDGTIVYSPNPELIGQRFPLEEDLAAALAGAVNSELSPLDKPEQSFERESWDSLIETYAPVWRRGGDQVIAVTEFYQTPESLEADIRQAQLNGWLVVGAVMLVVYLTLTGIVGRASQTLIAQQAKLEENVHQLSVLLQQNQELHERVRRAAARTTALNERYLRRISADLHDGPAQDLALALLRIGNLPDPCPICISSAPDGGAAVTKDMNTVRTAVESALAELREISAGLRLPEIASISPAETARRAVRDYEQKTKVEVTLQLGDLPAEASLPVKITLYRVLKEALANGYRHAGGLGQTIHVAASDGELLIEVSDVGGGFDPHSVPLNGHLGLVSMRERVEVLGGRFEVDSRPSRGTTIRAVLPLTVPEVNNG